MPAVADTTPLNYLILIRQIELLPKLFGTVLIPVAVFTELQNDKTPIVVRNWIEHCPIWLQVRTVQRTLDPALDFLDAGEQQAIALAEEVKADRILLDETDARREASRRKLRVVGTLGILREGARREMLDLSTALAALQETTFHVSSKLIQSLLDEDLRWKHDKQNTTSF